MCGQPAASGSLHPWASSVSVLSPDHGRSRHPVWWGAGPQQVLTWAILEAFVIVSDLVVLESLSSVCSRPVLCLVISLYLV